MASLAVFPKPALLYFLHEFGGADLSHIRHHAKAGLLKAVRSNKTVQEKIARLVAEQPIYTDAKFLRAWKNAFFDLPHCTRGCLKRRFYAMLVDKHGDIAVESANFRMTAVFGAHRFCTAETCIRSGMSSRTDASIGDCGHAPLWCLRRLWGSGYARSALENLTFYEAGFNVDDFSPWISDDPHYTCLQCQNAFAVFGVSRIFGVKYKDGIAQWVELPTSENFYTTREYAQQRKEA